MAHRTWTNISPTSAPVWSRHNACGDIPQSWSLFTQSDAINRNSALKLGSVATRNPLLCCICGYKHGRDSSNGTLNANSCPPCPPPGGSGDKKDDECDDASSGGDSDPPPPGGNNRNARILSNEELTYIGYGVLIVLLLGCFFAFLVAPRKCNINENMISFFNKSNVGRGKGYDLASALTGDAHTNFKSSMESSACRRTYGDEMKCPGLVNYASVLGGASVVSTGNTTVLKNMMLCRCQDKAKKGHLCKVGDKSCSNCVCSEVTAATIIKDDEPKLTPGVCWAFSGTGEVQIVLILPIVVFGVTVHHPAKSRLLPGYISSAPKDFELWGMNEVVDPKPLYFGKLQYDVDGEPTQVFEVQNHSPEKYAQVKFNFSSNHGNPNYTSLYKLEVHGFTDYAL